jgi:hypothetical protein
MTLQVLEVVAHKNEILTAGRQHQARARVEAESFEAALLARCPGPVEQGLARTAATFYFAVRLYHWRRMSRARRRDKELAEAVAAGNALERILERLHLLPTVPDKPPTPQSSPADSYVLPDDRCKCVPLSPTACDFCLKKAAAAKEPA